jgi:hypothetical protein
MSEVIRLTPKLAVRRSENYEHYMFYCLACKEAPPYCTQQPNDHPKWSFNGDMEKPTFSPSLFLIRSLKDYEGCGPRCHLFIRDGKIEYQGDCEHALAGQTVDMVEFPEGFGT